MNMENNKLIRVYRDTFIMGISLMLIIVSTFLGYLFFDKLSNIATKSGFLIIPIFVTVLIIFFISMTLRERHDITDSMHEITQIIDYSLNKKDEESKNQAILEAISQKKQKFLNIPNITFHYVDRKLIESFYNDYFREPTIESLVKEMITESSGELKTNLPKILESKANDKNLTKWISNIKITDISINEMFKRYQRETISKEQVKLGLELVDIELTQLETFRNTIKVLDEKFNFKVDEIKLVENEALLKEKAAEKTLKKLEEAIDWVLIEGKFCISDFDNDSYKCIYTHPVTEYMQNCQPKVTISVLIPKNSIEQPYSANYKQSINSEIPLKVYGKVWQPIDRKANHWDLQIIPLAVF